MLTKIYFKKKHLDLQYRLMDFICITEKCICERCVRCGAGASVFLYALHLMLWLRVCTRPTVWLGWETVC